MESIYQIYPDQHLIVYSVSGETSYAEIQAQHPFTVCSTVEKASAVLGVDLTDKLDA
jgi:hypothetical protein